MVKPVKLAVVADTSQLRRGLAKAEVELQGFGSSMKRIGAQLAGAFVFGTALRASFDELKESQKVAAQTEAAIKSTGAAANVSAGQVADLASALSKKSGIDDELIQSGENLLLTFTKVRNEVGEGNDIFDRATEAALDLSVAGFGSVTDTSKQLGKALQDPITGMGKLSRAGVTFSESQKETIRSLVETGDVLGAQRIILEEVERQVGGSAEAYGETLPGQIDKARNALEEAGASILGSLAPAMESLAGLVSGLAQQFTDLPTPVQNVVVALGATAFITATDTFKNIVGAVKALPKLFDKAAVGAFNLAGNLSSLAGIAAGGAIAVGLVLVFKDIQERAKEAAAATDTFAEALRAADPEAATLEATLKVLSDSDFDDILAGTDANFQLLGESIRTAGTELDEWDRLIGSGNIELFRRSLEEAAAAGDPLARELTRLKDEFNLSDGELFSLIQTLDMSNDAFDRANAEVAAHSQLQEGLAGAQGQAADATEEHANAAKDLSDALKAQFDPLFAAQDALLDNKDAQAEVTVKTQELADAQRRYNDALAGGNEEEIALAALALAEAQRGVDDANREATRSALDVQTALNTLTGQVRDGTISLDESAGTLDAWVQQGLITEDQADQTKEAFALLAWVAGSVPKEVTTNVKTLGIDTAIADLLNYEGVLDRINAKQLLGDPLSSFEQGIVNLYETAPSARAEGGPVTAGTNYMVGEEGPELFVPNASGTIIPHDETMAYLMGAKDVAGRVDVSGYVASGGPVTAGGNYLVGEEGPELFVPNASGTIVPNDETMAYLMGSKDVAGRADVSGYVASGGPVTAGSTYLVGEEGPELFIPNLSGTIVSNDETMAWMENRAAGGPVVRGRPYLVGEEGPEMFTSGTVKTGEGGGMTIGTVNFNVPASEEVAAHTVRKMRQMAYLLGGT